MNVTFNYTKYLDKNPVQQLLIRHFFRTIAGLLRGCKIHTVLDVGCGEGKALSILHENHIGKVLKGIDISREALLLAKQLHPWIHTRRGDIYRLPYASRSFDLVMCVEVLEHLVAPHLALRELRRVSTKFCLLTVPHEPFFRIMNVLRARYVDNWGSTPGHIHHWNISSFTRLVELQGFTIIAVKTPFPWIIVLAQR